MKELEFYEFIKKNADFFSISAIEKFCNISAGSLSKNIKRDFKTFEHTDKLFKFYDVFKPLE